MVDGWARPILASIPPMGSLMVGNVMGWWWWCPCFLLLLLLLSRDEDAMTTDPTDDDDNDDPPGVQSPNSDWMNTKGAPLKTKSPHYFWATSKVVCVCDSPTPWCQ